MAKLKRDLFILPVVHHRQKGPKEGVIRVSPETYRQLETVKGKTGIAMGRIAEECISFALERLLISRDGDTNA